LGFLGTPDRERSLHRALQAARRGVELDPENPYAHHALAAVFIGSGEVERSLRAAQQSVKLNPNFALGWCQCGASTLQCRTPEEAIESLERGLRLSPFDRQNFVWLLMLAWSYGLSGQANKGVATIRKAQDLRPDWSSGLKTLAVTALAAVE
ncbi:hypothetical protein WDZ92_50455, partial [Nostoc sp. NIES-2111]